MSKVKARISYKDAIKRRELVHQMLVEGKPMDEILSEAERRFKKPLSVSHFYSIRSQMRRAGQLQEQVPGAGVQPVRRITSKLKRNLQGVVNEMARCGVERLIIDSTGAVQATFAPMEQIFDLENGENG